MEITWEWFDRFLEGLKGKTEGLDLSMFAWVFITKLDQNDMRARICFGSSVYPRVSTPTEVAKIAEFILGNRHCAGLVVACDLNTEGNEPPPGAAWNDEVRRKAAIMGDFAWTLMVMRSPVVRRKFLRDIERKRLLFAVLDGDKAELCPVEAEAAVETVRKENPPGKMWR